MERSRGVADKRREKNFASEQKDSSSCTEEEGREMEAIGLQKTRKLLVELGGAGHLDGVGTGSSTCAELDTEFGSQPRT